MLCANPASPDPSQTLRWGVSADPTLTGAAVKCWAPLQGPLSSGPREWHRVGVLAALAEPKQRGSEALERGACIRGSTRPSGEGGDPGPAFLGHSPALLSIIFVCVLLRSDTHVKVTHLKGTLVNSDHMYPSTWQPRLPAPPPGPGALPQRSLQGEARFSAAWGLCGGVGGWRGVSGAAVWGGFVGSQ